MWHSWGCRQVVGGDAASAPGSPCALVPVTALSTPVRTPLAQPTEPSAPLSPAGWPPVPLSPAQHKLLPAVPSPALQLAEPQSPPPLSPALLLAPAPPSPPAAESQLPALPLPAASMPEGAKGCRTVVLGIAGAEYARSNRSFCKVCSGRIVMHGVRFLHRHAKNKPASFLHPECIVGLDTASHVLAEQFLSLSCSLSDDSLRPVVSAAWTLTQCF